MKEYEKILKIAKENNGTVTAKQVRTANISTNHLSILVSKGVLERVNRGIYILAYVFEDEMFVLQNRYSKGIFSHESALFLHGLTDRTPFKHSMTFSKSYNITKVKNEGIEVHRVKKEFYDLGIVKMKTNHSNFVKAYSAERTLCDILRARSKVTIEIVTDAFKMYSKRKDKDLNTLIKYAKILKVEGKVRSYMEVLM